jgi:hypothetical protein
MSRVRIIAVSTACGLVGLAANAPAANAAIVYPWCAGGRISETGAPLKGSISWQVKPMTLLTKHG